LEGADGTRRGERKRRRKAFRKIPEGKKPGKGGARERPSGKKIGGIGKSLGSILKKQRGMNHNILEVEKKEQLQSKTHVSKKTEGQTGFGQCG